MNIRSVAGGNLVLTGALQDVPGVRAAAMHGNGPILALLKSRISNGAATGLLEYRLLRGEIATLAAQCDIYAALVIDYTTHALIAPLPGRQIWTLQARTLSGGPFTLVTASTFLNLIELPEWDTTPLGNQE